MTTIEELLSRSGPRPGKDGVTEIHLYLRSLADAAASHLLVPLPYLTLDADLVASIEEQVGELKKDEPARLVFRMPAERCTPEALERLRELAATYLALYLKRLRRAEKGALREVLGSFGGGFLFMLACQVLRLFLTFPEHPTLTSTFSEGLLVLGWVALWNPYDRFLFAWLPAVRHRRLVERIARLEIDLRPSDLDFERLERDVAMLG